MKIRMAASSHRLISVPALALLISGVHTYAQEIINPAVKSEKSQIAAEAVIGTAEIDYASTIERKFVALNGAYGFNEKIDLLGVITLIPNAEISGFDDDGNGYSFAIGARGKFYDEKNIQLFGYALVKRGSEDFERDVTADFIGIPYSVSEDVTIETTELFLGGAANFKIDERLSAYGSIALIPMSDVTIDESISVDVAEYNRSADISVEFDRADNYTARIGGVYSMKNEMWLRAELTLVGDETLLFAVGKSF